MSRDFEHLVEAHVDGLKGFKGVAIFTISGKAQRITLEPKKGTRLRRELVLINVTANPTAEWITQQMQRSEPAIRSTVGFLIEDASNNRPCLLMQIGYLWKRALESPQRERYPSVIGRICERHADELLPD